MDLQEYVDHFDSMTCIMSVEKNPDGSVGKICIEVGNKAYLSTFEKSDESQATMNDGNGFTPGLEYTQYLPRDLNFEHFIVASAVEKKPMHAYIHPERFPIWFNIFSLPLNIDDPDKYYCTYTQELSSEANTEQMTNLSAKATSQVLQTCIKLRGSTNFLKTMDEIIHDIRVTCEASYCCVMLTDFKEKTCRLLSEDIAEGGSQRSLKNYLDDSFINYAKSWLETIDGSNCLVIRNDEDMNEVKLRNPNWYRSLKSAEVNSIVLFPLQYNGETVGFIWATNFDTKDTDHIKETLELTTFFIASEIANYQLLQRLEMLSSTDLLTGVLNRNAMNNRVLRMVSGRERAPQSIGIVFADLNGLKPINDNEGHNAGDCLLKEAALILKLSFEGCEIYRAGGDEFVIVALDKPKNELEKIVEKIRQDSSKPENVSFAIGFYYDDKGGDIRAAMREADALMYEDKKQYYDRFPESRRK
ncbi:GGDEF domain-containing protein [Fibrobacter sp. UWB10]|uniref:GGDEF domain-containing protein n=1 Tax=Fibrobacter sp. UWB10 TaxID=1896201 RepID=UPI00240378C0|nr:GGDEF domain-containing protein [Fibrobacter sp. UWB10]SMP48696.1 diguanylate cyclase (GGDEF) domain-containing protein [Fibrobacter sp. UWB10]